MSARPLSERLRDRIEREGPLRFDDFQQAALYDPDGGYYERPGRVGRSGDFVTGASWHPAFARCLVRIASRLAAEIAPPIDVVDVGAGEGELLGFSRGARPEELDLRLTGVEASAVRRAAAAARVPAARLRRLRRRPSGRARRSRRRLRAPRRSPGPRPSRPRRRLPLRSEGSEPDADGRFEWVGRRLPRRPGAPRGARLAGAPAGAGAASRGPARRGRPRAGDRLPAHRRDSSSSSTTARRPAPSTVRPARTGRSRRSWGTA